ncbi:WGR domain-containing protein [Microvirga puerhi]|uniref:WGR domain-containing protein n=1 Tax=Microvirga puerhi TaxID=2876078 RepID=A0ABS7VTG2_9HYPH|nr:WGR domain-containing protein [Microvirga puerhi]MBZ6078858.1 WGR domain-containing protein [Microvirga puerhi]
MHQIKIQYLVLARCDHTANIARFYVLAIEESLFGNAALVREWGRIGTSGQRKVELHENEEVAIVALETWLRRKQRRGYHIREARFRPLESTSSNCDGQSSTCGEALRRDPAPCPPRRGSCGTLDREGVHEQATTVTNTGEGQGRREGLARHLT